MKTIGKSFCIAVGLKYYSVFYLLPSENHRAEGIGQEMDGLHEVLDKKLSDFLKVTLQTCGLCCNLKHCHSFCQIF